MIRNWIFKLWWPIRFALWLAVMIPVGLVTSAIGDGRQVFPASIDWKFLLVIWTVGSSVYVLATIGWRLVERLEESRSRTVATAKGKEVAWRKFMKRE